MSAVAGLLVAVAVLVWRRPDPAARLRRLRARWTSEGAPEPDRPRRVNALIVLPARVSGLWSLLRRRSGAPDAELVLFVGQLASLARGGVELGRAMEFVAGQAGAPELRRAIRTAVQAGRHGEPVARALLEASAGRDRRTAEALRPLVLVLTITEVSGAPTADALEHLARSLADDADASRAVQSVLAGPRSTATVLAMLPVIGLALGYAIGADPLQVLIGTGFGRICLLAGATLAGLGWWWSRRLIARAAVGRPLQDRPLDDGRAETGDAGG